MYKYVAVDMYATIFTRGGCNSINSRMRGNKRPYITWFIGHIVRRKKTKNEEGMEGLSFCFPVWLLTTVEWAGKDRIKHNSYKSRNYYSYGIYRYRHLEYYKAVDGSGREDTRYFCMR